MGRLQRSLGVDIHPVANGGSIARVFTTGDPHITGHSEQEPGELPGLVHELGVRSHIAVRLVVEGERRGVVSAHSAAPEFFSDEDLRFLIAATHWIGALTHRAELVEQVTPTALAQGRRTAARRPRRLQRARLLVAFGVSQRRRARLARRATPAAATSAGPARAGWRARCTDAWQRWTAPAFPKKNEDSMTSRMQGSALDSGARALSRTTDLEVREDNEDAVVSAVPHRDDLPGYDPGAAFLLSIASAWAYSDGGTLERTLTRHGFKSLYCRHIQVSNHAMFVVANAFLIRSACGRIGILCFRGTEPTNVVNWLTDASAGSVAWGDIGRLHGGFHRNAHAAFRDIVEHLRDAMRAEPADARDATSSGAQGAAPRAQGLAKLEALYITGHSLGGAMAVITTAMMFADPECQDLRDVLRGVYTFGQPMICDPILADHWQRQFGRIVFRHVFSNDIVPRLPPRTMGEFHHFGDEYVDENGTWVRTTTRDTQQACSVIFSNVIGISAWVMRQFRLTQEIDLPFSWEEHSPVHYVSTSAPRDLRLEIGRQASRAGLAATEPRPSGRPR